MTSPTTAVPQRPASHTPSSPYATHMGELPFFHLAALPMQMYQPELHGPQPASTAKTDRPAAANQLPLAVAAKQQPGVALIPRDEDCFAMWEKYAMLDNIKAHSLQVAIFAQALAQRAQKQGKNVLSEAVRAAALLHDLGKTYCIAHGGNHAQLGAAWVMQETRNPILAAAVLYHVHWHWEKELANCLANETFFPIMAIIYADKRVKHDSFVSIEERFEDLFSRYGTTALARTRIQGSYEQGKYIEQVFSEQLGVDLHEYTIDSGRLVART